MGGDIDIMEAARGVLQGLRADPARQDAAAAFHDLFGLIIRECWDDPAQMESRTRALVSSFPPINSIHVSMGRADTPSKSVASSLSSPSASSQPSTSTTTPTSNSTSDGLDLESESDTDDGPCPGSSCRPPSHISLSSWCSWC